MITSNTQSLIEALVHNEELIGKLYQIYAEQFPARRQFWLNLADEENMHAAWLRGSGQSQEVRVSNRFSISAVSTYRAYLQNEIELAGSNAINDKRALTTSLYIEESLIEKKFFDIFTSESRAFRETLNALISETQSHISKIKAQLK
jgi:hypothetical protein